MLLTRVFLTVASDVAELFISMIKEILEVQMTENHMFFDSNTGFPK